MQNKFYLILFLTIFSTKNLKSQTYHHSTLWTRLAFQKTVKALNYRLEIDWRRQNDFHKDAYNPIAKPLLSWIRLNTSYETGKFTHSLILPNIIKTNPLIGKESDLKKPSSIEWRYTAFEEFTQPIKKTSTAIRLGYEFRNIHTDGETRNTGRLRIRLSEHFNLTKKSRLTASYEPLYNVGPNPAVNTFNQSQTSLRYQYRFGKSSNLTVGYNHLNRKRPSLVEFDLEDAIICNVLIGL